MAGCCKYIYNNEPVDHRLVVIYLIPSQCFDGVHLGRLVGGQDVEYYADGGGEGECQQRRPPGHQGRVLDEIITAND